MKKQNIFNLLKKTCLVIAVFVLIGLVYKTSSFIVSSSVVDGLKIDKTTSNYLSFSYTDDNSNVFEIDEVKILSDFQGKRLLTDYYDFEVSLPEDTLISEDILYEVIINDMSNTIDEGFIKIYLSDQKNNSLAGFKNTVPVLAAFNDSDEGKIIYTGSFNENNLKDKLRLRIWVSDSYEKKINDKLAFSIKIKIK